MVKLIAVVNVRNKSTVLSSSHHFGSCRKLMIHYNLSHIFFITLKSRKSKTFSE